MKLLISNSRNASDYCHCSLMTGSKQCVHALFQILCGVCRLHKNLNRKCHRKKQTAGELVPLSTSFRSCEHFLSLMLMPGIIQRTFKNTNIVLSPLIVISTKRVNSGSRLVHFGAPTASVAKELVADPFEQKLIYY